MEVWILFIFLSVSWANCNDPSSDIVQKEKAKLSTIFRTFQKGQTKMNSGQVFDVLEELFDSKGKASQSRFKNVFTQQKRIAYTMETEKESRKRKENVKNKSRKKLLSTNGNGIHVLLGSLSSAGRAHKRRMARSAVITNDICNVDSNKNLYTMKIYPRPSDYVRHIVDNAGSEGALCLDGTPAVYFLRKAKSSSRKWIIFLPGGAWCSSKETCLARSRTDLGSSKYFPPLAKQGGILSSNQSKNPHFYDWNVLYLQYCDGGSFLGNLEKPIVYKKVNIYIRGWKILSAFLDEIVTKYLAKASEVVVVGNSASALGVMANADYIFSRIPLEIKVHFVADGGFFVDVSCRNNEQVYSRWMNELYTFHNVTGVLLRDCVASFKKGEEWKCLMPENFLQFTKSSIAIINSLSDAWQLIHLKGARCGYVPRSCNRYEFTLAQQLRKSSLEALKPIMNKKNFNFFLFSCIKHCTITYDRSWRLLKIGSVTVEDFVHSFIRGEKRILIDDNLNPNNPACM